MTSFPATVQTLSDVASALASVSLALAAGVFLYRRRDLAPTPRLLVILAIAFLLAEAVRNATSTLPPDAETLLKLATALVAVGLAIFAWPQLPRLLALPSQADLAHSNTLLAEANQSLESTIARRTQELADATLRFETALSRSNITVFTEDRNLVCTWVHNPRPGLIAGPDGPASPGTEALKRSVVETGETANETVAVGSPEEGLRYFDLTVSPTRDATGAIDGLLGTAVDVTEKRLFEVRLAALAAQIATTARRFELALDNSPIIVFEQDRELRYTFLYNPPEGVDVDDTLGRSDRDLLPDADQRKLVPAKQRVLDGGGSETIQVELDILGIPRDYEIRLEPRVGPDGSVEGVIGTAFDLTERRRNERQMRIVMRELTHRSKNLLAVVQAMARKTASMAPDVDTFIRDFSSRLRAIAAAHDLLVAESWSGADVAALLAASLSQSVDPAAPEIHIEGPALKVSPDTAQMLGLAFHELTMNAMRHGALSVPGGRLTVRWEENDGTVALEWREEGGPAVTPPTRSGFGRVLLERLVGASLSGSVEIDYAPEGLVCRISFPQDRLIA